MASVIIGDYRYTVIYEGVRVSVVDKTKSSYLPIESPVTIDGNVYYVTDMSFCFYGCASLTQAPEIPSSVTDMTDCFNGCTSLIRASEIPSSVTKISHCFYACTSLIQAPEIPLSVTRMDYCFRDCSSLIQAPEIPSSVTSMSYCFEGCTSLTQAPEIPSSVTSMSYCFEGCTSLTQAPEIPSSVTSMSNCFADCTSLTQAPEIPSSVTNIEGCFAGCTSLTGFLIVHNIPSKYDYVFDYVSIKVISVGSNTYEAWSDIVAGYPNVSMAGMSDLPDILYINNADGDYKYSCFKSDEDEIVSINTSVKSKLQTSYAAIPFSINIANREWNITNLTSCFLDCASLTQAPEIPSSVTSIERCFFGCTSLTQAPEIPSGVTNMYGCFWDCTSLIQAPVIPSSVTDIRSCFGGCSSLTQAPVIPSGVTNIRSCFGGCSSLTQAPEIPSSVTDMRGCFSGCTSLIQAPVLPSGVTSIDRCFSGCTSLAQAPEIPSSVEYMPSCFKGCTSLIQAPEIPSSVTMMSSCFSGCTSLTGNVKIAANAYFTETFADTILPIYLINNTSPKDSDITATLKQLSNTQSNLHFEADDIVPPTSLLKVVRVDDDEDTMSSIDGLWAYLNAITTVYNTGLPIGWRAEVNGGTIYVDSVDVTNSAHVVGPTLDIDKYVTNSWYDLNDVLQHTLNFGIKLDIYDDTNTYVYTNVYPGQAVILSSSIPLVSYKAGGDGLALGQVSTQPGFYCNLDANFKDANNVMRALFDFCYPVGSSYSTVDPTFDPNDSWGGTWEKLPEGYILLSGSESGTYQVGADTSTGSGYKEYGSNTHTLSMDEMPSHNHGSKSLTGSMRVMAWHSTTVSGIVTKSNQTKDRNPGSGSNEGACTYTINATHTHDSNGGGQAHSIMQRSIAVYWWIRTA